jgi:hypothetical protein
MDNEVCCRRALTFSAMLFVLAKRRKLRATPYFVNISHNRNSQAAAMLLLEAISE